MSPSYPAPGGPASRTRFPNGTAYISDRPMNHYPALGVSPGGQGMFRRPMDDETKLGPDETIFVAGEDGRKLALATSSTNETTGPPRPMTGDRHDQGFFRNRCCWVRCRRADRIARLCPPSRSQRAAGARQG